MPGSTMGIGTPAMPSAPPTSITLTNVIGHAHSALPPLRPAHRPDGHHGQHMVEPAPGMGEARRERDGML